MKIRINKIEEGTCPYCESTNLSYGSFDLVDSGGYYSVFCFGCQRHFNEYYDFTFVGHGLFDKDCSFIGVGEEAEVEMEGE